MHLLAAEAQRIDEGEAVDLDLAPAPVVVLSAADGEIAAFAEAACEVPVAVRLASLSALTHPMSVDLLAGKTLRHARVIAVRVLGGEGYFAYGIEVLRRLAAETGAHLLLVPGEAAFDPALAARGTDPDAARRFHAYCREGGPENRARALRFLAAVASGEGWPEPPAPLPVAGLYRAGRVLAGLAELPGEGPAAGLVFYRAHLLDGQTAGINALVTALEEEGLRAVPVFASSLKDGVAAAVVRRLLDEAGAEVVLTTMAFSAAEAGAFDRGGGTALDDGRRAVIEVVQSSAAEADWRASAAGLSVRDLAMSVVTTEFDGRILSRAAAFRERAPRDPATGAFPVTFRPAPDRARFVARLAAAQARLATTPAAGKRVALVLANYPGRDGRIANGVGLDTPASAAAILTALRGEGYDTGNAPATGAALIEALLTARGVRAGASADGAAAPLRAGPTLPLARYRAFLATLPEEARAALLATWGEPEDDPTVRGGVFPVEVLRWGNVAVAVQPTRGYERDVKATYHDPALVPTHAYLAFYLWLREAFGAHAVVHVGKHGNMEWLPGKATALSAACWPEIAFGPTPHVYPFIVNDPGEGTSAKRRAQAVIVDHLTPPMSRAESHGAAADLEALVDEYALARALDPARARRVADDILARAAREGFAADLRLPSGTDEAIAALDAHLCDLKELQIRDGLHILGASPEGRQRRDTLLAIARAPRGPGPAGVSLLRAIVDDFGLAFDPLAADAAAPWQGPRPAALAGGAPWRTAGDTVERLEAFAIALMDGAAEPGPAAAAVLDALRPVAAALDRSGEREIDAVLSALAGRFVAPGPSGAPTRGRPDVLPTGRNFYSVDVRGIPTRAAWAIGSAAAERVVERYVMEEGDWPRSVVLTCWGTSNMRTGGDDIAQALALIGAEPVWDAARLTGFTIRPLGALARPRVDVTLRISGFFRDAFPEQIALFDAAARAVAALPEPDDQNPLARRFREEGDVSVFGAMPGAYGAGLQALVDSGEWDTRADLAEAFVLWGRYGYGKGRDGSVEDAALRRRLAGVDAVVQAQDNREHDILDSDDYYQFEGGLAAAVEMARGRAPLSLHVDTSRPERPVARTLREEIARVVRGRAANPKWLAGVMRHGYKGAFEIAATVDYLFAFAATTDAVASHHFDIVYDATLGDDAVRAFMAEANAAALAETAAKFAEAIRRGLWTPTRNSVHATLASLAADDAGAT